MGRVGLTRYIIGLQGRNEAFTSLQEVGIDYCILYMVSKPILLFYGFVCGLVTAWLLPVT